MPKNKTEIIFVTGKTYDTVSLQEEFEILGFGHGFVAVKNKTTGEKGSFDFGCSPRLYHNYVKHEER